MSNNTQRMALPKVTTETAYPSWNQALTQLDVLIDMYVLGLSENSPPSTPTTGDTYILGESPTGDWTGEAGKIANYQEAAWNFYTPFNGLHAFVAPNETVVVYNNGIWIAIGSADFATKTGSETFSNKNFSGSIGFHTNGSRIGITSAAEPLSAIQALVQIVNENSVGCGLRVTSYWEGSTATPYQNNDTSLYEVFNKVDSSSLNRSWAGSFANAYNAIPVGVTDSGTRVGVIGWAVSVNATNYNHAGTLTTQIGVQGTAGFQGAGSAETAVITNATGVRGYIYSDSEGATIVNARAGEFISTAVTGIVQNNVAVYASAANGTATNYSFYGNGGQFYNAEQVMVGYQASQSNSYFCARNAGNAYEFGHPNSAGYGSNFGALWSNGSPFIAFCAEADPTGNTFTTRGKKGTVLWNDLAGAMVFSRISNASASGQSMAESARFDSDGHLKLATTPYLPSKTPASATAAGTIGEIAWDENYFYVCTATDTWKRVPLSTW